MRGTGQFTYFAADCAYYLDKRDRGFDKVMIILGADHHGYVGRMRAVAACFGDDPDQTLEILIGQLVKSGRTATRSGCPSGPGTVVTIDDLVGAVGVDAARYALARYSLDSPIDLDLDLWTRRSTDNPVYYVQYAHARIASLMRRRPNSASLLASTTTPACSRRPGERPAEGTRRLPRRAGQRDRTAPAPPDRQIPRRPGRRLPPVPRRVPVILRDGQPWTTSAGPGSGWPSGPARPGQRPGPPRRHRARPALTARRSSFLSWPAWASQIP